MCQLLLSLFAASCNFIDVFYVNFYSIESNVSEDWRTRTRDSFGKYLPVTFVTRDGWHVRAFDISRSDTSLTSSSACRWLSYLELQTAPEFYRYQRIGQAHEQQRYQKQRAIQEKIVRSLGTDTRPFFATFASSWNRHAMRESFFFLRPFSRKTV